MATFPGDPLPPIDRQAVERLMKRCQIGVGGRNAVDTANEILAECYGTLGRLLIDAVAFEAIMRTVACKEQFVGERWAEANYPMSRVKVPIYEWRIRSDQGPNLRATLQDAAAKLAFGG